MVERLISFAGSENGAYGCVTLGAGNRDAAAVLARPGGSLALAEAEVTRGEGTLRLTAPEGELIVGLAAQTSPLAFETGPSRRVTVQAVGASVELGAAASERFAGGFEATGVSWALEGESDQSLLRTLWAALADGSVFVLFALRSADADEHGAETIGAARIARDGAVASYAEPLLSTEYDADRGHQRATLELWGEEEGLPTRGAGRLELGGSVRAGGAELHAARFGWRLDGTPGFGAYEIVG